MGDLWDLKFKILDKMNRKREAIDAAKDGLRNVPTESALLLDVAKAALDIGDLDTAQQHAEAAVAYLPSKAHELLADIWSRRGNVAKAEAEAKLSLKDANDPTPPLVQLATIEKSRGNLNAALDYDTRAVERENGRIPKSHEGLHVLRGDVLARVGRNSEAEQEFRTEIEHFPGSPNAYASLILLLASEQRVDEATKLVFDLIKTAPTPK
jgi:tetratricopeptide (TPR) repeat protein